MTLMTINLYIPMKNGQGQVTSLVNMCVQVHAYILETSTILKFQNRIYFLILS